tara:strand:+ start:210 stop:878 length:669 start_codon:yes stop_codon:yes gene_type:complete
MELIVVPGGAFVENTYILKGSESDEAIIIDPGSQINEIEERLSNIKFQKVVIINTHAHLDHIYGVEYFKNKYNAPFLIHQNETPIINVMADAAMRFGLEEFSNPQIPNVDRFITENEELNFGGLIFNTILVPGHSPGSLCFSFIKKYNKEIDQEFVICGDTVFAGSIGRVDLTGGTNMNDLVSNINEKLMVLPDDTILFPGHGPETQVGIEKKSNPFLLGYA